MKHKTSLLVACILTLVAVQQAQVGAETTRRVIGYERAVSAPNQHAARLVVTYTQ